MPKSRTDKVVCYIVTSGHVVVFTHRDAPLERVGVQVPAGTIRPGESQRDAALREAAEETGLDDLRVVRKLGEADYDISPYRHEIMRRYFYELTTDAFPRAAWEAGEPDPEGEGDPLTWECQWIPLKDAHVLAGGLSAMIGRLVDD